MTSIKQSNRVSKSKDYWNLTNSFSHWRHSSAFIIYTESSERLPECLPECLPEHLPECLSEDLSEGLSECLSEDLSTEFSDEDLSSKPDEALSSEPDKALSSEPDKALSFEPDEALSSEPDEALSKDEDLSKHLSRQLHEGLGVDPSYQPQFLPKDRAGKPQNLSEDSDAFKLFQLFFPVKEIENIVEQTNQQAAYIVFKCPWKPLTVTETYHYLGCLVYMGVQPLQELSDHWYHLKSPVASCFTERCFQQIRHAFIIQDPNTSPEQPGDSWWFRIEPLATTIRKACQKYWTLGAHLAVDECMIPYLEHTWHAIKTPHKSIKQGYKIWALADLGYIFS